MIFLSTHLPSNSVPEAGQKICFRHLKEISEKRNVYLVSFVNEMEAQYIDKESLSFCESTFFVEITNVRRFWNLLLNFSLPLEVAVRSDARVFREVTRLLSRGVEKEIYIEYEQAAFILPKISKDVKSTVVFHDIISQSVRRRLECSSKFSLRRFFYWFQLKWILNWERRLARLVDNAVVLNEKDKSLLIELGYDPARIKVDYPVVSESFHAASRERFDPETILFWGAMNRSENEDAVLWFMQSIYPQIKKYVPGLKFIILGANPSDRIRQYACSDIEVTGFVDDPVPYFERAALAISPLRYGAGVKLKVLEAIAANLPIVGTSIAAEGVEDISNLLHVKDNEVDFANFIINYLVGLRS